MIYSAGEQNEQSSNETLNLGAGDLKKIISKGQSMKKGRLFVLSGPSGTGKGTICKKIVSCNNVNLSVSMTTRNPRDGEAEGENYFFVTDKYFRETLAAGGFLESAEVYGSLYGTPKKPVLESLNRGEDVILEIDIQGALKIKESFPQGIFIFILPPSIEELEQRLRKRGTETEENIRLRLSEAVSELSYIEQYDYCVINDDLDDASRSISAIIKAEHLKVNDVTGQIVKSIIENN